MVRVLFFIVFAKLRIENPFNSIELKQKVTYTGACHTIIDLLGNCQFSAKDEKLFLLHQSPGVSLPCWCFWRWLRSHFVSLGDWSTKWRFVVVLTHVTGMHTCSSRLIYITKSWMKVTATQTPVVNLWRKPSSNYLTGEIQGKQTILEVFKCEESVQSLERFSIWRKTPTIGS